VNKSYNEPAVAKANLPAAIKDIGKSFHERADSFTHTNAKNEVTNRKRKGARRKEQEKKDESSFTELCHPCFLCQVSLLCLPFHLLIFFPCSLLSFAAFFLSVSDSFTVSSLYLSWAVHYLAAVFVELCLTAAVSPSQRGYSPMKTQQSGGDRRQIYLDFYWLRAGLPKRRCDW